MVVAWVTTTRLIPKPRAADTNAMLSSVEMCPVARTKSSDLMTSKMENTSGTSLPWSSRR